MFLKHWVTTSDAGMSVENVPAAPFMHPTPILLPALPIAYRVWGSEEGHHQLVF
jgi:hypothetical protein